MFDDNENDESALPQAEPAVPELEELFSEKVRSIDHVLDYASTCALAIANGNVPVKLSKELRLWGELMYTCIQAQKTQDSDGDVNFIGQLIQIAGTPGEVLLKDMIPTKAIEAIEAAEPVEIVEADLIAVNE